MPAEAAARPLLLLAPHLEWPARNGADVTHDALGRALSRRLPFVDVVGAREVVRFEDGQEAARRPFANRMRARAVAALRTIGLGSHYYREKFNTPGFAGEARRYLADEAYGAVLHSYLTTAALARLPDPTRPHLVWTHNDEFRWFDDLGRQARDPVSKAAAARSGRWLHRFMREHERDVVLLHVTEEDRAGWARRFPEHRGRVVPIGVALPLRVAPPLAPGAPVRLLFLGALGIRMNLDALTHFAVQFWPALRAHLGDTVSMTVVGSRPMPEVRALCTREGWTLRADVPEAELDGLYEAATFSLLPFSYATGAKLKLLRSLAHGVPVLATAAVGAQSAFLIPPSLSSDAPEAWAVHAVALRATGVTREERERLRALAEAHSWDASARLVLDAVASV